jgi:hypothetical protein
MTRPRYILTEAEVVLELTRQQAAVLDYVLRRAQEDRGFFNDLAGSADPAAAKVLRQTLAVIVNRLQDVKP